MNNIYILSGLGVDERVFKFIDFGSNKIHFIKWIQPLTNESIDNYSKRLLVQINSPRPILIGLSFGGMMAVEISKHIETSKIILISSAKTRKELPFYFRWIGLLRIHKINPISFLKQSNFLTSWFFGTDSINERKLLRIILKETDSAFLKWAIDKILSWKNDFIPKSVFHIHGNSDKILPIQFVRYDSKIDKGGHLMILNKAATISKLLSEQLV
jgi:hypothetical protein